VHAWEYEAIVEDLQVDGILLEGKQMHFMDLQRRHIVLSCDIVELFLGCLATRKGTGLDGGISREKVRIRERCEKLVGI
jgi:hypothetical protein